MTASFHEVRFPLRLSLTVTGGPVRRTDIVNLSNGRESRNQRWQNSRRSYDAGSGIRSVADLYEVLEFFEARAGEMYGFRFRDPVDWKSCAPGHAVAATDQALGAGDGTTAAFQLIKAYGDGEGAWLRTIAKPVAGSVSVALDGVTADPAAYGVDPATGLVVFSAGHVPAEGVAVTAGFEFDVPVRFATDRIDVNLQAFNAGRIPTIPLMEILP
ncbi:TIGR02217 family protein [Rhizobium sp. NRK18]|uniref:TIGR02217 family protein n=1 Tax=Rhizobium sp. NRK18 TaxID=2964667 RepID=UPI0021C364FF|nr:TIGR02217 family protein [Rhizobium sp. NRK18]MCQ2004881.1 TIGR02217 family protein [Rhizobium sp. NRK18]